MSGHGKEASPSSEDGDSHDPQGAQGAQDAKGFPTGFDALPRLGSAARAAEEGVGANGREDSDGSHDGIAEQGERHHAHGEDGGPGVDLEHAESAAVADLVEEVAEIRQILQMTYFSGPIPEPSDLYSYTPDHQERIFRIAESGSTDESDRRDRVTNAQIKQSNRAQWITPVLLIGFGAVAAYFFAVNLPWAGTAFLAMPALRFLGTFVSVFAIRKDLELDDDAKEK